MEVGPAQACAVKVVVHDLIRKECKMCDRVEDVFYFLIRLDVPTVETQWLSLILTLALHA